MRTKIIFVNPPLKPEERYGHRALGGDFVPPIGLCNLAASTREKGWEVSIIDAQIWENKFSHEILAHAIVEQKPKYVGLTSVTAAIYSAARLAQQIKSKNPDIITIIGGDHLTALPEETMEEFPSFDIGVIGEGDITIVELLQALDQEENLEEIPGLVIRNSHEVGRTPNRPFVSNLDSLPFPAWDLLPDLATYYRPSIMGYHKLPAGSVILSRGCPGQCIFCDRAVFGNNLRSYSAEYSFKMIEDLYYHYGMRDLEIRDENLVIYRKRLKALCQLLIESKMKIYWSCNARADHVDPDLLSLMRRAGCWQIAYGIESGNQEILDFEKKGISLQQIEKAIKWTAEAGIEARGFFMIGHPKETEETLRQTVDFAKRLRLHCFHTTYFTPLPGSEVYKYAHTLGEFDNDWSKLTDWFPVFIPHGLTKKDLEYYSKRAFTEFYLRPRIIWYYFKKLRYKAYWLKLMRAAYTLFRIMLEKPNN